MPKYFEFEVSLPDVKPRIWRRFLLKTRAATFHDLHMAIQDACGWENCHLFCFRSVKGRDVSDIAGVPFDDPFGTPTPDAKKVKLASFFGEEKSKKCEYEYDFGDSWLHEVKLRGIVDGPEKFTRKLLAGKRAFPPEDCGGVPGYYHCLDVFEGVEDVEDDDDDFREWLGDWDPARFDLEETRKRFDR